MLRGSHFRLVYNALPIVKVDYQDVTAHECRERQLVPRIGARMGPNMLVEDERKNPDWRI